LQISVKDGQYKGLDGLDPTLTWSDSTSTGDLDLSYGIKAAVRPTTDLASLPRSIWGKASTDISGWGVSARAEVDGQNFNNADVELQASNSKADLRVSVDAQAGKNMVVRSVEATKGLNQNGARITVTPRYNLQTEDKDVVLTYSKDNTNAKLTASADSQELTVSQQIDADNRLAPTINNNGDFSLEYERRLSDSSSLTANLKPNDSLDVEWKDADWTANVKMPIDGTNVKGVNVGIRRDVEF
jgi:adenine specific DNA methylase Mod